MLMVVFIKMKEVIVEVMVKDVEVGLKRSDTITFTMMNIVLMMMG